MAKPLYVTEEMRKQAFEDIEKKFAELKEKIKAGDILKDSTIKYEQTFKWSDGDFEKPTIEFSPKAWIKTVGLVATTSSEIAWHGIVDRKDDLHFVVDDIVMFPQVVSAATVTVDQEEKMKWFCDTFKGEERNKVRLHGHSHVDMATTPSSTDMNSRSFVKEMVGDQYYIFMIINKSYSINITLYDMKTNGIYNNGDLNLVFPYELDSWMAAQKEANIKKRETTSYKSSTGKNNVSALPSCTSKTSSKKEEKLKVTVDDIMRFINTNYSDASKTFAKLKQAVAEGEVKNNFSELLDYASDYIHYDQYNTGTYYNKYRGYYYD